MLAVVQMNTQCMGVSLFILFLLFYACSVRLEQKFLFRWEWWYCFILKMLAKTRFLAKLHPALWAALLLSRQQLPKVFSYPKLLEDIIREKTGRDIHYIPMNCKLFQILVFNLENFWRNTFSKNSLKAWKAAVTDSVLIRYSKNILSTAV